MVVSIFSVSKALIDKMGATQLKGRRLAVWQKVSRLPFFRGIVGAELSGDRYLLDLKRISIADFMKGLSFKYKNDMYYNSAASTTRSITRGDGTRSEVTDLSARYTDPEGYVHPAAVLFTDLDMKDKKSEEAPRNTTVYSKDDLANEIILRYNEQNPDNTPEERRRYIHCSMSGRFLCSKYPPAEDHF